MSKAISKKLLTVLVIIAVLLGVAPLQAAAKHDNNGKHWARDRAHEFMNRGIIKDEDGLDDYLTRIQFVEIINNYFGFNETVQISFTDVTGISMQLQVQTAYAAGYIKGYPDGTFRPDKPITRQEAAVIIAKLMKFELFGGSEANAFGDAADVPAWSWGAVNSCIRHGILKGYPDRNLWAKRYLTKAEVLSILGSLDTYIDSSITVPVITSLTLANGTAKVNFIKSASGLTAGDFTLSAKLDGISYTLSNLSFNTADNIFSFTPIAKTNAAQTLQVTVGAAASKISGAASKTIEIPHINSTQVPPEASLVSIGGNPRVGNTLIGHYTYTDENSDPEGASVFKWYRANSVSGTGKTLISNAAGNSYQLTGADAGKYITFEVTPIAQTGTLTGTAVQSSPKYIYNNGNDILSFTLPGQTSAAVIDTLNHTVTVQVAQGTSLVSVAPSITVSDGAALTPASGVQRNFMSPVSYTVTAEDGASQIWTVNVGAFDAAPTASNVSITGTPKVGRTLTGQYTYSDVNGDLEGVSIFKWYRADSATGANKAIIAGASSKTYTTVAADTGKYLSFEVTPVALTGAAGTLTGVSMETNPLYILKTGNDILSFSISEQTGAAAIDYDNHTVSIQVGNDVSLESLTPAVTVSDKAAIFPASGVTQSFTSPVLYVVTAEDGTPQLWIVSVTAAPPT